MTSRLKRKLNDLGVDTSSHKASENFCLIGTPLPPLEKSKDTGEFVPLWKQDVRDEQGRRRLHGAFTGGFSAGYFNTVGSKEGWTPSTFTSSRSERAKKKEARPEDYMDEEDLAELRESRKLVDENEEMDFGSTETELRRRTGTQIEDDPMANTLAAALAPAPQDSVGARILRKMGWRIGQGVGPRITYEQRRAQDRAASGAVADEAEDEEAKKHMYPRRDTPLLIVRRKDNSHGLGYSPGLGLNESLGREGEKQGPNLSSGFGLGALNDADDDDLDVYDGTLRSSAGRRVAYEAGEDEDVILMGSSRQPNRRVPNRDTQSTSATQTFRDGRAVLKGFVVSDKPVSDDRLFPLPDVPAGWKPNPKRVWEMEKNKENQGPDQPAKGEKRAEPPKTRAEWKSSLLSADERGSMLGETPLPSKPRSVFDFLSQKDRERLERARESLAAPAPASTPPSEATPVSSSAFPPDDTAPPHLHPSVAKAALSGFQPFQSDPVRHSRYTIFLQHASAAEPSTPLMLSPLPGQRPEDFRRELTDYAKSATVFKPLSGAMASRFQSAVIVESGPKALEGLHMPVYHEDGDDEGEDGGGQNETETKKEAEDPKKAAVRLGMYGPLTREVVPWQPARLLYKRFNVRDPEVETSAADGAAARDPGPPAPGQSTANLPLAITDGSAPGTADANATNGEAGHGRGRTGRRNMANIGLGDDDDQGRDTLTYERPAMDVFKAIFASDDEESDDEDESKAVAEQLPATTPGPNTTAAGQDVSADPATTSYTPDVNSSKDAANEPVDPATFKPTFVPRKGKTASKDKEKKDKKKKTKTKTLVSFDTEEEGLQVTPVAAKRERHKERDKGKDGERKKKKRKEKQDDEDDDSMWVEAPAPEIVQHLDMKPPVPQAPKPEDPASSVAAGPPRGRKRAVDFM